jgi:hypothetical protein
MNRNGHAWPDELALPNVVINDLMQLDRLLGGSGR